MASNIIGNDAGSSTTPTNTMLSNGIPWMEAALLICGSLLYCGCHLLESLKPSNNSRQFQATFGAVLLRGWISHVFASQVLRTDGPLRLQPPNSMAHVSNFKLVSDAVARAGLH